MTILQIIISFVSNDIQRATNLYLYISIAQDIEMILISFYSGPYTHISNNTYHHTTVTISAKFSYIFVISNNIAFRR